jgi:hypothetical protein
VLGKALERANEALAEREEAPLPPLTPHALMRSFASLLYAIGEAPPVVMAEMGHTDPAHALAIYAQPMRREEGENERLRALVEGATSRVWSLVTIQRHRTASPTTAHASTLSAPRAAWWRTRPAGFEPATSASGGK